MKANLIILGAALELVLSNGEIINAAAGVEKDEFIDFVTKEVDEKYMEELKITEVTKGKLSKKSTVQLERQLKKAVGLERDLINSVLDARGKAVKPQDENTEDYSVVDNSKKPAAKKTAKKVTKPKAKKAPKVEKEPKEKMTLDAALTLANESKVNVGKVVTFDVFRTAIKATGTIKSVWIDKRVPMVMYKIEVEEAGKKVIKNKTVLSPDLKIK